MRISDWSSDVCSSDLAAPRQLAPDLLFERGVGRSAGLQELGEVLGLALEVLSHAGEGLLHLGLGDRDQIGRASCRESVLSVRVDLGGRRIIKKKKQQEQTHNTH